MPPAEKYPWKKWLKRRTTITIHRRVDYRGVDDHIMAQMIRNRASLNGLGSSIRILKKGVIRFRFTSVRETG